MSELSMVDVFMHLKPLCESFNDEPSAKKAERIGEMIEKTPATIVQRIHEIIIYPLTRTLKSNVLKKDDNIFLIKTIRIAINKMRIENFKLFCEVFYALRHQICLKNNITELIESHEELKEAVVTCMGSLFKNSSVHLIEKFYTRQHAALLSHGIYQCVKLSRLEKSANLRIEAIQTLTYLLQIHDEFDSNDVVLKNNVSNVIMLYLPGVVSGLLEVSIGSDIQNHKVTMLSIRAWSKAIALVMDDALEDFNSDSKSKDINELIKAKDEKDIEKIKTLMDKTQKTKEWYTEIDCKIKTLFVELDKITRHSHFKVRKELAEGVTRILLNCSKNMQSCFQILLEILITLSEDENSQVSDVATQSLQSIQEKCIQDANMKTAAEMVEENLFSLLTQMPRIIRTSDSSVQLVWLNRLAGYLKVLGKSRLTRMLLSTAHLKKLLLTMIYVCEFNCSEVSLLEDVTAMNFDETMYQGLTKSWKQHKFLFDSGTVNKLMGIFEILGKLSDIKPLVDSILKMMNEVPKFRKELIFMLNSILKVSTDSAAQKSTCKQVIEQYVDPEYWNLPIKVSEETSLQAAQSNVVQCSLLLEGLGVLAHILQEEYQIFLLKTLYLVIERAGSDQSLLRYVGLSALDTMAKSQKLQCIGDLFRVNVDYISYHVIMKLRRVERNPGVLDVVEVVTNYSTMDFLPHLKDIVDDLLLQSSSNFQKKNSQSFLKVFYAFTICVKRLMASETFASNENDNDLPEIVSAEEIANSIAQNFLEFKKAQEENKKKLTEKLIADNELNENSFKDMEAEDETPENFVEEEEKLPYYITMVKSIMKRCMHFLPSSNFDESSLAMLTLAEGALILKKYENELLPIVHEIWHPLVDRFKNVNPLVINRAWQLLFCLAEVSRDFIRARTLKGILPALSTLLKNSAKESLKKHVSSSYQFTQLFKMQNQIVMQLGKLVKNLSLAEKDIWDILSIIQVYLDCLQHTQLQESCVHTYKVVSCCNADLVWSKCIDIWHKEISPINPDESFEVWYENAMLSEMKSSYQQRVCEILKYIRDKRDVL
ncbi:hypothetical protein TKK_0005657 [Trichogramma kaykai]